MSPRPPTTRRLELAAALLTALGKIVFMDTLDWRAPYIATAVLGWIGYVVYQSRREPGVLRYWGLKDTDFRRSSLRLLPVALLLTAAFFAAGSYFQTSVADRTLLYVLLLYPIWGIVQQFIVLGVFARNLEDGFGGRVPAWAVIFITAALFGLIHYPFPLLMLATFFLGLVYCWLFLRGYSLIALGIYHGLLGGVFFYTVLGRNPWVEAFG